jgi:transposase
VPVDPQRLSRDELVSLVVEQAAVIQRLEVALTERDAWVEALRGQVAELRRLLDQDSSNSSRPPSSDSPYGQTGGIGDIRQQPGAGVTDPSSPLGAHPDPRARSGSLHLASAFRDG